MGQFSKALDDSGIGNSLKKTISKLVGSIVSTVADQGKKKIMSSTDSYKNLLKKVCQISLRIGTIGILTQDLNKAKLVPSFEKCIFLSKRLVRMTSAGWCLKKVFHTERIHIHLILLGKLSQFTFYEYLLLDFLFSVTIKRVFSSSRHV